MAPPTATVIPTISEHSTWTAISVRRTLTPSVAAVSSSTAIRCRLREKASSTSQAGTSTTSMRTMVSKPMISSVPIIQRRICRPREGSARYCMVSTPAEHTRLSTTPESSSAPGRITVPVRAIW